MDLLVVVSNYFPFILLMKSIETHHKNKFNFRSTSARWLAKALDYLYIDSGRIIFFIKKDFLN